MSEQPLRTCNNVQNSPFRRPSQPRKYIILITSLICSVSSITVTKDSALCLFYCGVSLPEAELMRHSAIEHIESYEGYTKLLETSNTVLQHF
jgi:hypothetical protein